MCPVGDTAAFWRSGLKKEAETEAFARRCGGSVRLPEGLTFVRIGCGQDGAVLLLDLLHVLRQLFYTAPDLLHLNQKHTRTKSESSNTTGSLLGFYFPSRAGFRASVSDNIKPDHSLFKPGFS